MYREDNRPARLVLNFGCTVEPPEGWGDTQAALQTVDHAKEPKSNQSEGSLAYPENFLEELEPGLGLKEKIRFKEVGERKRPSCWSGH